MSRWVKLHKAVCAGDKASQGQGQVAQFLTLCIIKHGVSMLMSLVMCLSVNANIVILRKYHPRLPSGYVLDNLYLVANDKSQRLSDAYAAKALDLLDMALDGEKTTVTVNAFRNEICRPLKKVELWHRQVVGKFGTLATECLVSNYKGFVQASFFFGGDSHLSMSIVNDSLSQPVILFDDPFEVKFLPPHLSAPPNCEWLGQGHLAKPVSRMK